MNNKSNRFIILDDDLTCIELCKIAISNSFDSSDILTFSEAGKALYHLMTNFNKREQQNDTILFLDINMPSMNGWSFIDCFSLLDQKIKNKISIIVLSSSTNPNDKIRAAENIYVSEYIEKHLLYDQLYFVLAKYSIAA